MSPYENRAPHEAATRRWEPRASRGERAADRGGGGRRGGLGDRPPRDRRVSRPHRSRTSAPSGRAQQTRVLLSAGGSTGSVVYVTLPDSRPVSQLWQTPVRHDQRTGTSQASASSSRLAYRW